MKRDLQITDLQFGVLGSVVYAGMFVGASVASGLYEKSHLIKRTLAITLFLNALSLEVFVMTKNFYLNTFIRFWIGFFQIFQCIYMPVWADNFASEKKKTAWLAFLILSAVLGVVIGYGITSIMISIAYWQTSFIDQGSIMVPCIIGYMCFPLKYLDIQGSVTHKNICKKTVE